MNSIDMAVICKVLGDQNRLQIIEILAAQDEMCACNLLEYFEITQPTLSHHMKVLNESGLVETRKEGKWNHYSLNQEVMGQVIGYFTEIGKQDKQKGSCCK